MSIIVQGIKEDISFEYVQCHRCPWTWRCFGFLDVFFQMTEPIHDPVAETRRLLPGTCKTHRSISIIINMELDEGFVVHPVHTEAVAYISGRADSLVLIFSLTSFAFYLKCLNRQRFVFLILMIISYSLALLSRENALILPFIILAYHWIFKKRFLKLV